MSPDAVVRAWFKEVWDEGNEAAIDRLMAPDAIAHGLGSDELRGPGAFKPYVRVMRAALGDLEVEVVQTLTDGDRVAAHCHVVARHVGALFGAAATQRPVDFWGMTIVRVRDGKIVEIVERESSVARASSALLATPLSRSASITRRRFPSRSDASEPLILDELIWCESIPHPPGFVKA